MQRKLVSVITVTYENLEGLERTFKSVSSQTNDNIEWIVIDGGSKDGTVAFLDQCTFPNMNWVSESDSGIFDAMNKGIARSSGDYCIFMNAGDVFASSDILSKVSNEIGNKEYNVVYGDSLEDVNGALPLKKARDPSLNIYSMFTHHQSIFYLRDKILSGYDQSYKYSADWAFTTRVLNMKDKPSHYCPFPICIFERGGVSMRDDQRKMINKEHWRILRQEANLGIIEASLLWFVKTRMNMFRKFLPKLYDRVRFGG